MSFSRQAVFWLLALVAAALILYLLRDILLPFVAGMALAYLLDPVADRLERVGVRRVWATTLIMVLFLIGFAVVLLLAVPIIGRQFSTLMAHMPDYLKGLQGLLVRYGGPIVERLGGPEALQDLQNSAGSFIGQATSWFGDVLKSLWSGGQAVIGVVSFLVVAPVVAFYLLVDWDRMVAALDGWVPPRHRETVRELGREIDGAIAGFVRGQAGVCLFLAIFYSLTLSLVGLNFAILIGLLAGSLTFIPYVGSLVGLVVSFGVASVQFWPDWTWIAVTVGVFFLGQFLEGNVVSPMLVGASVGLHPVWLMFALLAFGSLFGFVGLLLAVPLAAAVGVLARFAIRQYLASSLYQDGPRALPRPENDA